MEKNAARTLDRIDLTILDILQKQGRITNVALSRQVHLSPSPCLDRVKRLEDEGYIENYGARLNAHKLGLGVVAYIQITLDRTTADIFDHFKKAVVEIPEVEECQMVAGGFDYLLKLRISDMEAYRVLLGQLVELPGVAQTHTYVVIEQVKQGSKLPLRKMSAGDTKHHQ